MTTEFQTSTENKSNSMAGAVQVEASLPEELRVHFHYRKLNCACCLKRNVLKLISHVPLALTVSEILKFQIFYLEKRRSRS